jgi:hypothetical protein
MERRREILQAVQEALGEFLWEEGEKKQDKSGLKPVPVE